MYISKRRLLYDPEPVPSLLSLSTSGFHAHLTSTIYIAEPLFVQVKHLPEMQQDGLSLGKLPMHA